MAKISSYGNEGSPKLSDKLIGTSVGGNPADSTFNFTLQSLLSLFSENITLQDVLDAGNTATQDINLTGSLVLVGTATLQNANISNSLDVSGDANFNTAQFNGDVIFYNPTTFQDVLVVPEIQFANPAVSGERTLRWNNVDGTADLVLKGGNVTLQIGQEEVALVVNKSGVDLLEADFKVVKVLGAQGQRLSVDLAQADSDINSATTLGVVTETILNNAEGFITTVGMVNNINATGAKSFSGLETWNDGDILYLDPVNAGYMTNVKPVTPAHLVTLGYVVNAANNGKIYVKIDNGYELDELHDVKITTPVNKNFLVYDSSLGYWRNRVLLDIEYSGKFKIENAVSSVSIGNNSGGTGNQNVAVGVQSLELSSGNNNVSLGFRAMQNSTSANTSVAIGTEVLQSNTTGVENTAVGYRAMQNNTVGNQNIAIGRQALIGNISGNRNTAIGYRSLLSNLTNSDNVAVGHQALLNSSSASYNTAIGSFSSTSNVSGQYSSALGYQSLQLNTTGVFNSAFGALALKNNTSGGNNTALGYNALGSNNVGSNNIAIGHDSLVNNITGNSNVAIGKQAGQIAGVVSNNNSSFSIFVGQETKSFNVNQFNEIVIGYNATGNGSNTTTIGNNSQTSLYFGGNGAGLVLKSPNGTKYRITVDNSGNLVTTAI